METSPHVELQPGFAIILYVSDARGNIIKTIIENGISCRIIVAKTVLRDLNILKWVCIYIIGSLEEVYLFSVLR